LAVVLDLGFAEDFAVALVDVAGGLEGEVETYEIVLL